MLCVCVCDAGNKGTGGTRGSKVRRSLFDGEARTPLQRSNTSISSKRKRSSDALSSPSNSRKRARLQRTPRDERKRRSTLRPEEVGCDDDDLGAKLFTPIRKGLTPSGRKNRTTSTAKKG